MSDSQDGISTIQAFFKELLSGHLDEALELVSPGVVWRYHGPETILPFAGTFEGHSGVRRFFEIALQHVEILNMKVEAIETVGEVFYIRGRENCRVRSNGVVYDIPWLHRVAVHDGQITSYEEYLDTAAIMTALAT